MIGYLRGTIIDKKLNEIWVDVNGVGYRVRVGKNQESRYKNQESVELFIHTAVREDAITLYGFNNRQELDMFELLLNVSGVGPKTALTIVGSQSVETIEKAAREADVHFFQNIPGIGKKGSQRIIVDLKGKIPSIKEIDLSDEDENDAVYLALKQFGFKPNDIDIVMKDMDRTKSESEQVREGLKRLGRK
jgi:Holliday junction DNA helicase RuvA